MASKKISELTEQLEYDVDADLLVTVDASDTTMAATGTNKKIRADRVSVYARNAIYEQTDIDNNLGDNLQEAVTELNEIVAVIGRTDQGTWVVSGGGIAWVVDYFFDVAAVKYYILGSLYTAPMTQVGLSEADETHNRFDAIVANTAGEIEVITGVASANPVLPTADPSTQVILGYIRVDADTTSPEGLSTVIIYRENTEWTTASNSANIVANSTDDPYAGTLVVRATSAVDGNAITFTNGSAIEAREYQSLNFYVKFSAWPRAKTLNVSFIDTANGKQYSISVAPGVYGVLGTVTAYQLVSIPITAFSLTSTVDRLEIAVAGGGAAFSFAIDNIELAVFTFSPLAPGSSTFLTSINELTAASQLITVGTTGTDFNVVSQLDTHTINLPDASTTNRGAVTTGAQTLGGAKTFDKTVQVQAVTLTPSGTTAAMDLGNSNHQTLSLVDSTGAVTVTVTPPSGRSAGTIIVKQHATTARNLTWAMASGTSLWMGTQPAWSGDATEAVRVVSWVWDGSVMYFAASGTGN